MSNIIGRLYRIARANFHYAETLREILFGKENAEQQTRSEQQDSSYHEQSSEQKSYSGVLPQIVEDLKLFNLTPPSSLEEVRRARNQEFKKFHSDKFMDDPEKFEMSNRIMQIYNAAFSRLEEYYADNG